MATSMSIRFQWGRRARLLSLHSSACSPDSCATSTSLFLVTALLVVLCCMLSGKNYKCFVFPPYSQLSRRLTMYHCSIHVSTSVQNKLAGWDWQMWSLQARRVKSQVYLQQIKKKAKAEGKTCHAKRRVCFSFSFSFSFFSRRGTQGVPVPRPTQCVRGA